MKTLHTSTSVIRLRQCPNWVLSQSYIKSLHTYYLLKLLLHLRMICCDNSLLVSPIHAVWGCSIILGRRGWKHVQLQSWILGHLKLNTKAWSARRNSLFSPTLLRCQSNRQSSSPSLKSMSRYTDTWSVAVVCQYDAEYLTWPGCWHEVSVVLKGNIIFIWRWSCTFGEHISAND